MIYELRLYLDQGILEAAIPAPTSGNMRVPGPHSVALGIRGMTTNE